MERGEREEEERGEGGGGEGHSWGRRRGMGGNLNGGDGGKMWINWTC